MRKLLAVVLGLFAVTAGANECRFSANRDMDIDLSGLHALAFKLHSSDLHAEGVAGLKRIEVRAKACASEESWLADLTLSQSREGDRVVVTPAQNHTSHFSMIGSSYAYIDINVRLPAELLLDVDTGSGDVNVAHVAALTFVSGSGDLILSHVTGAATLKVGSGDITADDIGALTLDRSGSGDIRATQVRGDVKVGHVGSGDLQFRDIGGGVHVESVGSGDVNVQGAKGDVTVGSIGSGDVTVDGVGGAFVVRAAGSGDIHHHNVSGKVEVPHRHESD